MRIPCKTPNLGSNPGMSGFPARHRRGYRPATSFTHSIAKRPTTGRVTHPAGSKRTTTMPTISSRRAIDRSARSAGGLPPQATFHDHASPTFARATPAVPRHSTPDVVRASSPAAKQNSTRQRAPLSQQKTRPGLTIRHHPRPTAHATSLPQGAYRRDLATPVQPGTSFTL